MPYFLISLGSNLPQRAYYFQVATTALQPLLQAPILLNHDRDGGLVPYWNQLQVIWHSDQAALQRQIEQLEQHCERARYRPDISLDIDLLAQTGHDCQPHQLAAGNGWHWQAKRLPLTADVAVGLSLLWPQHYQADPTQWATVMECISPMAALPEKTTLSD